MIRIVDSMASKLNSIAWLMCCDLCDSQAFYVVYLRTVLIIAVVCQHL